MTGNPRGAVLASIGVAGWAAGMLVAGGCAHPAPEARRTVAPVRSDAAMKADGYETFALVGAWSPDPLGAPAEVHALAQGFCVRFEVAAGPPSDKCVLSLPARMSLAGKAGVFADAENRSEVPVTLALGLKLKNRDYFESEPVPLRPGTNANVLFDLEANAFKCAATQWRHEAVPGPLSDVGHIMLLLYSRGRGEVVFRNIRVAARPGGAPGRGDVLLPVPRGGVWGYADGLGRVVIPPRFARAGPFSGGLAPVTANPGGRCGFVDASGALAIEPKFDRAMGFSCDLAAVRVGQRWGYISRRGEWVVQPELEDGADFCDGLAAVRVDGLYGFIDTRGSTVISSAYEAARGFREGLAAVRSGGQWGFINAAGRLLIPARFADARDFCEGLAAVKFSEGWGYIDRAGKTVVPPQFSLAHDFAEGLAPVETGGRWGYIGPSGQRVIGPLFEMAEPFSEGLAAVILRGRWGYVNPKGVVVIEAAYDGAMPFSGGLASVQVMDESRGLLWGYINRAGQYVVPLSR